MFKENFYKFFPQKEGKPVKGKGFVMTEKPKGEPDDPPKVSLEFRPGASSEEEVERINAEIDKEKEPKTEEKEETE